MIVKAICKLIQAMLKKSGRGTSFPGELALKLDKKIIGKFQMPKITVFVTGTAGKTSVTGMIASVLENAGYKVGTNSKGSNLSYGVVSTLLENSTITGKSKVDAYVIEIDERYVKKILPYITPNYFVICNLSRDQLARNGHFDFVFDDINQEICEKTHLILNADNPLSSKFALDKKNMITYFGVAKNKYSSLDYKDKIDVSYCPRCKSKINYEYFNYGNFGLYKCSKCDFQRQKPEFEAVLGEDSITIDGKTIKMPNDSIYNIYNIAATYTIAKKIGIESSKIVETLNNLNLQVKRFEEFSIGNNKGTILLSKNETPISYNQSLNYVSRLEGEKIIAIGFTRISGRYDDKDISWLYDIDFSLLNKVNAKKIILFGKYSYDLAVRLKVENIDMSKVEMVYDFEKVFDTLKQCDRELYCIFYFDMEKLLKKQLKENGEKIW